MKVKVYYEDTDAGGVVYYANYLRFMERARTEFLSDKGVDVAEYHNKGYFFTVIHVEITYKRPAKLGDILDVGAELKEMTNVTVTFRQDIFRNDVLLAGATVKLACINSDGKPRRLPQEFDSMLPVK
jgi:tol-pal system-associated acyl-CoA thioesterase